VGKDKHFLNPVNTTRSETDSKPPAALVSIEILSFGDWKCCKAYFFFFSEIIVWFYCSASSGPFCLLFSSPHHRSLQREDGAAPAPHLSPPHRSGALSTTSPRFVVPERQGQVRQGCQPPKTGSPGASYCPGDGLNQQQSISACIPA